MRKFIEGVSKRLAGLVLVLAVVGAMAENARADAYSLDFSGQNLTVAGEYINGVPVGVPVFAPSFQAGQTITGSIAYDTNQPDTDPGQYGTYRIGSLSVQIPELALFASRSSNSMQISAFDNTPNPNDQFFAYVDGVDSFSNGAGLPNPTSFSVLLFGSTSMLANDLLPTTPIEWTFGNISFNFFDADDSTFRQVLMTFTPAPIVPPVGAPEPTTLILLSTGMIGLGFARRKLNA